ncbi:MAG: amidohydrolase [Fimbriimonadaceae bacterium]|nr:amidohydrolase [Fimbriimonadaceae bacterium]
MRELITNFVWAFDGSSQEILIEDGRVVFRGEPSSDRPAGAEVHDLGGAMLAPAFIDPHCHILPTGLDLQKLHLGDCDSPEAVLAKVAARHAEMEPGAWLHAVHYDQTRFENAQHLTRHDLDPISTERPILLRHVNGHASIANTAALTAAKIAPDVADPNGGTFVRDEKGELSGVLLERAHEVVTAASPEPTLDEMVDAILKAGDKMSEVGIIAATDMMTGRWNLDKELTAYRMASEQGCRVRLRLFLQWGTVLGPRGIDPALLESHRQAMDEERCRICGLKIFADGAIGSSTAAIYGSYTSAPDPDAKTSGQLIYSPERLREMILKADDAGWRLAIHSIGDYSTDLVMATYAETADPKRHRIEHAMLLSDAQIDRLAHLGCHVSMQPEFLLRFGHAYRKQLGPDRAAKLKRFRSVLDAGIPLSFSSDRPIVAGDPQDGIRMATNRPAGFDPGENVSFTEALRATTELAAMANGDEKLMGSLTPGQIAEWRTV